MLLNCLKERIDEATLEKIYVLSIKNVLNSSTLNVGVTASFDKHNLRISENNLCFCIVSVSGGLLNYEKPRNIETLHYLRRMSKGAMYMYMNVYILIGVQYMR